jgi:hypothetical protein
MAQILKFRLTKKAIYRAAVREMENMYRLSWGGSDPIIDDYSRELFETGQIEEVEWLSWPRYCQNVFARLEDQNADED